MNLFGEVPRPAGAAEEVWFFSTAVFPLDAGPVRRPFMSRDSLSAVCRPLLIPAFQGLSALVVRFAFADPCNSPSQVFLPGLPVGRGGISSESPLVHDPYATTVRRIFPFPDPDIVGQHQVGSDRFSPGSTSPLAS